MHRSPLPDRVVRMTMEDYDRVRLLVDLDGAPAGAEGTIVMTYNGGEAFCIEIGCEGRLITAPPRQLEIVELCP